MGIAMGTFQSSRTKFATGKAVVLDFWMDLACLKRRFLKTNTYWMFEELFAIDQKCPLRRVQEGFCSQQL